MENLGEDILTTTQGYYNSTVAILPKLGIAIVVFFLAMMLASWMKKASKKALAYRLDDPLLIDFLAQVIKTGVLLVGFVTVLNIVGLGDAAASLMAGAGIGAFVIGFAFKDIGENFLAGIMMAFKRPFRIGDIIETGSITGTVLAMNLRDTQVKTFNGKDVFIPNGMIMKNPIINRTIDGYLRYEFAIGLDYQDNLKEGTRIIKNVVENTPGVLQIEGRKASALLQELGVNKVKVTAYFWVDMDDPTTSGGLILAEAMEQSIIALIKAGYHLPADVIEIKNYKNLALEARTSA